MNKLIIDPFRVSVEPPLEANQDVAVFERQGETMSDERPLLDQHLELLGSVSKPVVLMSMGVFAVGLTAREPIAEYFDLIYGLIKNILQSILGKNSFKYN